MASNFVSSTARISGESVQIGRNSYIGDGAYIEDHVTVGDYVAIGPEVQIFDHTTIGDDVRIGKGTLIGGRTYIGTKAVIGAGTNVGRGALILEGAKVCPDAVLSGSSDARTLQMNVSIGPGVFLHNEVELGGGAVVPTQRTIASLGNLGAKNRVITIYGSDAGPLVSLGCQIGETLDVIRARVGAQTNSSAASAATYQPYLPIIEQIGLVVQRAYEIEAGLVGEIQVMRKELVGIAG